jgi:uncharacterized membrane protein
MMVTNILRQFFRDERQFNLFFILCLSTVFDFLLVVYRLYRTDFNVNNWDDIGLLKSTRGATGSFFFLIWNLFLAWIPYWLSLALDFYKRHCATPSVGVAFLMLLMWLLFFPNAPYILTDLLHLRDRHVVPHWYDLMLIISFAWTGLMLGYSSLFEIHRFLEKQYSRVKAWSFVVAAIWLGGFGVYMGRFQRWNSWDALIHPLDVMRHQAHVLINPLDYLNTLGMAVVLSGFLLMGYLTLNALRRAV